MSLKYKVITCSQDSRYPQDLVLTLRFVGEAPDANTVICIVEDAPDLLEALEGIINAIDCDDLVAIDDSIGSDSGDRVYHSVNAARAAIARARGEA